MVKKTFAFFLLLILCSCASKEDYIYFQNINTLNTEARLYEPVIKSDDNLLIFVSSATALPF